MTQAVPLWGSSRFTLALMAFLAFLNFFSLRVNISFAIVCMVNHTAIAHLSAQVNETTSHNASFNTDYMSLSSGPNGTNGNNGLGSFDINRSSSDGMQQEDGEMVWDKHTQGLIHGSLYWGYVLTNLAGGLLADRYGGKHVIGLALLGATLLTLLVPVVARWNVVGLMVLRFFTGVSHGFVSPAMQSLWSQWAPPLESSRLRSICFAGSQMGKVLTYPLTAVLCEYGFDGGWPSIFYAQGVFGLTWFVLWCLLVFDSPAKHPRISREERVYIETSLEGIMSTSKQKRGPVPWLSILTSPCVWAIIVTHICSNWGEYTFLTNIPTYLKEVLQYEVKKNGLMSSLPYVFFWLTIGLSSWLADVVRTKRFLSTLLTRKVFNTIGQLLPAISLIGVSYAGREHSALAMTLLTVGIALTGFQYGGGLFLSPGDIAPRYAGVVYGISNTMATLPGFLSPLAIGYLTVDQTQEQWRAVFFISAAIYVFGSIFFNLFASATLQPWAHPKSDDIDVTIRAPDTEECLLDDALTNSDSNDHKDKVTNPLSRSSLTKK
ncbi:hypothetical protein EGW08_001306 [Elysia chlorotica]|uniref:Major facilitator superfamily (MFS) profile domain-containing protein n=1 Tax=Elysia chlorotica TaxID=188477 RepID=A0A433UAR4_ELYCH|nr:hypothetical protein EGW08_001306 [Elysia chlorotica]